jgi:hypothetical protein
VAVGRVNVLEDARRILAREFVHEMRAMRQSRGHVVEHVRIEFTADLHAEVRGSCTKVSR